jgi:quinol---cytochrome c reductase iron-sulfur subunit, bacillus type
MPDKRESQRPRFTEDAAIPGAFEGESVTRRRFMVGTTHLAGAGAAMAFTLPALAFALGPVFERRKATWESVGPVSAFNPNTYVPVNFINNPGVGDAGRTTAYVRRFNRSIDGPTQPKGEDIQPYVAISTRCAHLGCPVRYVAAAERFICPCHGGVYDKLGKVNGGPPVRPLDRYYTRVRGGQVQIGPRFSVNSQLHRFAPRDPGEALDGVGQYVYPARFSTPKP